MVKERLGGLDALRFFAACLVMVFHLGFWAWTGGTLAALFPDYPRFPELSGMACGWVGVQIFFVISGFVIAYSAEGATPGRFAKSRFLRLAPALFVCSALTFAVLAVSGRMPLSVALPDLGRTWVLWPLGPWIDGVYWTLVIEVIFYVSVFALLVTGQFKHLGRYAAALGLASAAYNVALLFGPIPGSRLAALILLRHGVYFALGATLWLSAFKSQTTTRWALICACLVGGSAEVWTAAAAHPGSGVPALTIWLAGISIVAAAGFGRQAFARLPMRHVGLATYPLYLLHAAVGSAVVTTLATVMDRWAALGLGCALMVALSLAFVFLVEPPIKAALKILLQPTQSISAQPSAPAPPD